MTHRGKFITALEGKKPAGHVPTCEIEFHLTMELLGKMHPGRRNLTNWDQMSDAERELQVADAGDVYISIACKYDHSAIFIGGVQGMPDPVLRIAEYIREKTGNEYFLMCHGDATMGIPNGDRMEELSYRLIDDASALKDEQDAAVDKALSFSRNQNTRDMLDGFALCSDYCLNTGPFLSPALFSQFVTPYLKRLIAEYRDMGYYIIKHTDGNIMPILDQLVSCKPHALHSLDPQAGVDIAVVKERYGKDICLMGNVNCGLLQTGTDEEVSESARYALRHGMPGGGYIFSTSNSIYTGMPLRRYELMWEVWKNEGQYDKERKLPARG